MQGSVISVALRSDQDRDPPVGDAVWRSVPAYAPRPDNPMPAVQSEGWALFPGRESPQDGRKGRFVKSLEP